MSTVLLITLSHLDRDVDLEIRIDGPATVADIVDLIQQEGSFQHVPRNPSITILRTGRTLARETRVAEADLRSGDCCRFDIAPPPEPSAAFGVNAVAEVLAGPDQGSEFELATGPSDIGRADTCEIQLEDELSSRQHARVVVSDEIRLHDLGSTNGVLVNGTLISRPTRVQPHDIVTIGATDLRFGIKESVCSENDLPSLRFNRPPNIFRRFEGLDIKIPAPPGDPPKNRFSITSAIVPLVMVLGMYLYLTASGQEFPMIFLAFMLMSPVIAVGSYYENRTWNRRDHGDIIRQHSTLVSRRVSELEAARDEELASRVHESPSAKQSAQFTSDLSPRLWERHPDQPEFLNLRVGRASQNSRSTVSVESGGSHLLREELEEIPEQFRQIDDAPAIANLQQVGGLGISGSLDEVNAVARALVVQLAGLHSPSDLILTGLFGETEAHAWKWLGWLPHIRSAVSPLSEAHFGIGTSTSPTVLNDLLRVHADRLRLREERLDGGTAGPAIVVIIDESAPIERTSLRPILEDGMALGLHFIWLASARSRLPRACGAVLDVRGHPAGAVLGLRSLGEEIAPVETETASLVEAMDFARSIAPVSEVGGRVGIAASVPERVSLVDLLGGLAVLNDSDAIADRWHQGEELLAQGKVLRLRAPVGLQSDAPLSIDIRTDGPHALVAGTTGSGKSELLQTYVASLAATHSAEHVTFLLVDYKGGAAFRDCIDLPHTVGLVTDLNTSEVRRALVSLDAELRHREHVLNEAGAKDLVEMESMNHPATPPTLLLIVDEFAALAKEVPEFIEGVVDVALRGRSLGIHLVLATQRPAGVVTPQVRANTSLRIALRVADEDDSVDVLGSREAARLPTQLPGRALVKMGPREATMFQSAYAGGVSSETSGGPALSVSEFVLDHRMPLTADDTSQTRLRERSDTDLQRLVANVQKAHNELGVSAPRRPWLPPLAAVYDLEALPTSSVDDAIVFGVVDKPREQEQEIAYFYPDRVGSLLAIGASGSGKTVLLRTLAASAGLSRRGATTHVYALDFAGRGLEIFSVLPHVGAVIPGHDDVRVVRLLRDLRTRIDERSERFAAASASSLPEFRESERSASASCCQLVPKMLKIGTRSR